MNKKQKGGIFIKCDSKQITKLKKHIGEDMSCSACVANFLGLGETIEQALYNLSKRKHLDGRDRGVFWNEFLGEIHKLEQNICDSKGKHPIFKKDSDTCEKSTFTTSSFSEWPAIIQSESHKKWIIDSLDRLSQHIPLGYGTILLYTGIKSTINPSGLRRISEKLYKHFFNHYVSIVKGYDNILYLYDTQYINRLIKNSKDIITDPRVKNHIIKGNEQIINYLLKRNIVNIGLFVGGLTISHIDSKYPEIGDARFPIELCLLSESEVRRRPAPRKFTLRSKKKTKSKVSKVSKVFAVKSQAALKKVLDVSTDSSGDEGYIDVKEHPPLSQKSRRGEGLKKKT